jgi:hypothetical protein
MIPENRHRFPLDVLRKTLNVTAAFAPRKGGAVLQWPDGRRR